ncbi:type IA DNA topoisomerase [Draconibacterium sediminis]|uniref:DNA topoisomerase n=1 Tax=Draconibacterium sediminis TaxID=1544798 RepID=A0A0D8JAP6_9BACT|nr:type IA DNA topoisomerase [Draconibacterium sediminis]KJF43789.1 DNA topoisomerase III [Draconibacterium sediminis]
MIVCIAEKPSVAKEIAQVIGAGSRRDGYYEGNGYQVTWTFGHFCTLWPPEDYDSKWKRWDLQTLPMLPKRFETKVMTGDGGVTKQFNTIKSLLDKAEQVINCGDAGQEGELIQRWVMKEAGYKGEVKRLWISSLTNEAIKTGFQKLVPAEKFDNLYYAGSSRAIGDWLLGMNATRLYTLKYGGYKQVLSIGRVQTPTLAMLVTRHYEIENFKPEPYWELQTTYRDTVFSNTEGKFFKKEDGEKLLNQVLGKDLYITDVEKKDGQEYAPKLFDLTSLQVHCNTRFGLTADETLKTVQRLYEMKVVTYPRVDTTFLPNDQYPKIPGILMGLKSYSELAQPLLAKKIRKSTKVFNDKKVTDHHAIIPTGEEKLLGGNEKKVYDAIARRFLAAFYPDCKVAKTQVKAEVDTVQFVATGKLILQPGWRVVFQDENSKSGDGDTILPAFEKGEHGPHEPSFTEKETKPPRYYTEASLLRAMETAGKNVDDDELRDLMKANGIGRPSTRAAIIETLFRRKYIERQKKQIHPTKMGIQLIDTIQNELLKSAELTGQWEKRLREIEQGEYNASKFIYDMKRMVYDLVVEVMRDRSSVKLAAPEPEKKAKGKSKKSKGQKAVDTGSEEMTCPKCREGKVLKGNNAYGCNRWKEGCNFRLPFVFMEKKLTDKQVERLLNKGATTKLKGFKMGDKKVDGILQLTSDCNVEFMDKSSAEKKAVDSTPKCPKCGGTILKGKTAYGCSNWKEGCDFKFSFDAIREKAAGRKLTKELVLEIIQS